MKRFLLSVVFFCFLNLSYAQFGMLDPSFGNKGIVKTDIGFHYNYGNNGKQVLPGSNGDLYLIFESAGLIRISKSYASGSPDYTYGNNGVTISLPIYGVHAVLQTDDKIVVVGYTLNPAGYPNDTDFMIVRFNTNGSLDSTFDGDGKQITDFFGNEDAATSVAIQSDGKILVGGHTYGYYSYRYYAAVARYNTDGSLDGTFNGNGILTSNADSFAYATLLTIQNNGKIVLGGYTDENKFWISRYNTDGSIDSTFDRDGVQTTDFGTQCITTAIGIQGDGKIILAGVTDFPSNNTIMARYNMDGSIDSTFDKDGKIFSDGNYNSIVFQNDGKFIAVGASLSRYNINGSLDSGFGEGGKLIPSLNNHDVVLQTNGKILALGFTSHGDITYVAAARYNANGSPDNSFSFDGSLTPNIKQGSTFFTCTAIQSDGKILAAGYAWNGSNYDFALVRNNLNGSADNTFSVDGAQMTDIGSTDNKVSAIAIQTDGKIVVVGSSADGFAIARYNTDGSPDLTFDGDGIQTSSFGFAADASSLVIQNDGKIIVAGSILARYNTNGSPDPSFGEGGKVITPFTIYDIALQADGNIILSCNDGGYSFVTRFNINGAQDDLFGSEGRYIISVNDFDHLLGKSLAIQNDGKIVIGGFLEWIYRTHLSSFALIRINSDGSIDNSFNNGGPVITDINSLAFGTAVVVQNDNKIILGGYSNNGNSDDFTLARYTTDGRLDNTFNGNGVSVTPVSSAHDRIEGIAVKDNKLYASGFGQDPGNFGIVARYLLGPEGGPTASAFITVEDGDWSNPATWVGGVVPYATSEVIVKHKVTITTNTICYSLKVESLHGNLIITTSRSLTITH